LRYELAHLYREKALEKERKAAEDVAHKLYIEANKLVIDEKATLTDISL
jgi:hypothetical protein